MAEGATLPSHTELETFTRKLGEFRDGLTPDEQRMLDVMAIAAFSPKEPAGEVEGYEWFWHTTGYHGPGWYHYPQNNAWPVAYTPFGSHWALVP